MTHQRLPDEPTGTWRITTEHGSRAYLDFDDGLWRREPMARPGGWVNRLADGRWFHLTFGPRIIGDDGRATEWGAEVGRRIFYGRDMTASITTTRVLDIVSCDDADAPPPNPPRVFRWIVDEDSWGADTGDVHAGGEGPTREAALRSLGEDIDSWLDDLAKRGRSTRTARWWAARADRTGSVVDYVLSAAPPGD